MKISHYLMFLLPGLIPLPLAAQQEIDLLHNDALEPVNVTMTVETYQGRPSLKVADPGGMSEAKFVKIPGTLFTDGTIEVALAGSPAGNAFQGARGFVGIAFRINNDNSRFECFYLRPTNGRAEDQVRRNHAAQYISFPDLPWYKSRQETPGKYESYVDLVPGAWTRVKIEVKGDHARLYVHDNPQPVLIVNDLTMGAAATGNIGLWIGPGTEAHFCNLRVTPAAAAEK